MPGLPNPLLVGELFREYSRPWEGIARNHIKNVWDVTNRFLELVLQHLTEPDVCDKIMRLWLQPIMEQRLDAAYMKLGELLDVHKEHPMTTNHYFSDNRKKYSKKNVKAEVEEKLKQEFSGGRQLSAGDVARIVASLTPEVSPDMDMVAAEDAYDNTMAYYKVRSSKPILNCSELINIGRPKTLYG